MAILSKIHDQIGHQQVISGKYSVAPIYILNKSLVLAHLPLINGVSEVFEDYRVGESKYYQFTRSFKVK